jgi:hypothetical protein
MEGHAEIKKVVDFVYNLFLLMGSAGSEGSKGSKGSGGGFAAC